MKKNIKKKKIEGKKDDEAEISISLPKINAKGILNQFVILSFIALLICAVKVSIEMESDWQYRGKLKEGTIYSLLPFLIWLPFISSLLLPYARHETVDLNIRGLSAILFITALLLYQSSIYGYPLTRDLTVFALVFAFFSFFYSLSLAKQLNFELAIVLALFFSTLAVHAVPAQSDYLAALDPYWHYKWMQGIYDTGYPLEFDELTYPMYGGLKHSQNPDYVGNRPKFGLDQKVSAMMHPVSFSTYALSFSFLGVSLLDVAIVFPAVIAAFSVILMYLLVKEMFWDMAPYNKIAALTAAFILMLSPAFAMKALATNAEDDGTGMFFMIAGFFIFFASYNRKKISYSIFCGLAFLLLRMSWGGSLYAFLTVGLFGVFLAFVKYMHNENTLEHLPYILIPAVIYQLMGFIVHEAGSIFYFHPMLPHAKYPLILAIGSSIILEYFRTRNTKYKLMPDVSLHNKIMNLLGKNIRQIAVPAIVIGLIFGFFYASNMINWVSEGISGASEKSVVHRTVSEQNALASSFKEFLDAGYGRYGIALYYGLIMLVVSSYLVIARGNVGALFLLTWSAPMLYGAYHKSAWIFASSASVTALGAAVGLFAAVNKKDLESFRIVGTILILFVPMFYIPMFGEFMFNKFVGYQVMHMGPSNDRHFWEPALQYHKTQTEYGDAIVTWWDYGHWFTGVSQRPVLVDNLQADYHQIQDVARFFVQKTTEEEAFEILKAYDRAYSENRPDWNGIKYVTIDWTMIGKGSALHFIATGDIDEGTDGSWKNYIQCGFDPSLSRLDDQLISKDGKFYKSKTVAFNCQNYLVLVFEVSNNEITNTEVIEIRDGRGQRIPWELFRDSQDVSILGVQKLMGVPTENIPSIMDCALNYGHPQLTQLCSLPQFNTLILVPQEFNDFMMTKLYLGKYLSDYKELGLYNRDIIPLKHFKPIPDRDGDGYSDGEFTFGYVRSYDVFFDTYSE